GDSSRRVNIFIANKDRVWINVRARGAFDQSVTPVPMGGGAAAIEQAGPSKKHCASANRSDSPDFSGNLFQPTDDVGVDFVLFDCIPSGPEQGVDFPAHFPTSFVRRDSHT